MGAWLSLAVLILGGWAALKPATFAWLYLGGVFAFEAWLLGIVRSARGGPVVPGAAPYEFSEAEARVVARYPFYFTFPGIAKHASSVLAAIGLSCLVLSPWLTYRMAYVPALLAAANLLLVAWLTRRTAPLMTLGMAASRGNRDALEMLAAHRTAWEKIRKHNQSAAT
jgi:hypothetical protein